MAYDKSVYDAAAEILLARRLSALELADERRREIHKKIPRTAEIDEQLAGCAKKLIFGSDKEKLANELTALRAEKAELLCAEGYPANYLDPQFKCKKCGDTGVFGNGKCSCYMEQLSKQAFRASELAKAQSGMTFEKFELKYYRDEGGEDSERAHMADMLRNCRVFAEKFSHNLPNILISGGTGLGKTHLSSAIAKEVNDKGFSVMYTSAPKLFMDFEDRKFGRLSGGAAKIDNYLNADLLIIDDLGSEIQSELNTSNFLLVLNHRLINSKKLVITSNLSLAQIKKRYDNRIASRICGEFKLLPVVGRDIREAKTRNR